ncbi:hypothetical protein OMK64_18055 [Cellulomonas fimi]|uniref:hypothetical protein n=1 Tax=Cellulomonas fimi TaxID=1708 RepID=UPI00234CCCA8|nr:hypothetical protein [Cellulomonas fimi]MDC7123438.1 hypothetical protein [Cellulomonas fimi]
MSGDTGGSADGGRSGDGRSDDERSDDAPLDAAQALAVMAAARRSAGAAYPSGAFLFLLWGAVWLVGYGLMWLSAGDDGTPSGIAAGVAITLGVLGTVGTLWHVLHRSRGLVGSSARTGALYGWSWAIGFVTQALIVTALADAGAPPEVSALAGNALAALVVGLLYLAGGALWDDLPMYLLGAWIAVVGGASAHVGLPGTYLTMSLAGGGGMLVAGTYAAVREWRRRRA